MLRPTTRPANRTIVRSWMRHSQAFAQLFVLEATAEHECCWELGVVTTPSVVFFWDGTPVCVRRPDWDDDTKLVGAQTQEILLEVIRHTRECCLQAGEHDPVLSLDF